MSEEVIDLASQRTIGRAGLVEKSVPSPSIHADGALAELGGPL
ncbi:MAG: hypothetical protein AAGC60_02370 [Acidobacteriota bacterium]